MVKARTDSLNSVVKKILIFFTQKRANLIEFARFYALFFVKIFKLVVGVQWNLWWSWLRVQLN